MKRGEKKEYLHIDDMPVLLHTLIAFFRAYNYEQTIITIPEGDETRVSELLEPLSENYSHQKTRIHLVSGGDTRRDSVFFGLSSFTTPIDYVLIHDGARPWVSKELIHAVIQDCLTTDATIPVVSISDAVKTISSHGFIDAHLNRRATTGAQTPQAFSYSLILRAHKKASEEGGNYIDDSEIYHEYAGPVHTVEGDPSNIKITYSEDIERMTHRSKTENESPGKNDRRRGKDE